VQWIRGELAVASVLCRELSDEAERTHDVVNKMRSLLLLGHVLAYLGDAGAAAAATAALEDTAEFGGYFEGVGRMALSVAALARGDVDAAHEASQAAWRHFISGQPEAAAVHIHVLAEVAMARGDLVGARRWANHAVTATTGWWLMNALTVRARIASAQNEPEQAYRDIHDALTHGSSVEAYLGVSDTLECLAYLRGQADSPREAARLFGAAASIRAAMGAVRFQVYDTAHESSALAVRDALGDSQFDEAWAEGAALSITDAIAYGQRGRGERKRPTSGWESLTPTERAVVRLVSEGLANKAIAERLFISPRTVQTHLTHVYTKLGLTSRGQLTNEASRHN
jgi:DNA-binding CsgD family transcriptional regulator